MIQLPKKKNYLTHLPVIKSACDVFLPKGILELGCGKHSTSFFYNYNGHVVSLESDKNWHDKIKQHFPDNDKFKLIYHNLEGKIRRNTRAWHVSDEIFNDIKLFYNNILNQNNFDMLFIDHWGSIRYRSLEYLYDKFDIIIYHDAEDRKKRYQYYKFVEHPVKDFFHWRYCSFTCQTGILIRKKYSDKLEIFDKKISFYGEEFCNEINVKYSHKMNKDI